MCEIHGEQPKHEEIIERKLEIDRLYDAVERAIKTAPTKEEFDERQNLMDVLREFGFDEDFIERRGAEITEHENAHIKTAQAEGLKTRILLRFFKGKDGNAQDIVSTVIKFNEGKERVGESIEKAIKVPANLSPSDREKIE
jgi:phosphate uptake regulator